MENINTLTTFLYDKLKLTNKQFINECFEVMKKYRFSAEEIDVLIDVKKLNTYVMRRNRFAYPVLKEVSSTGKTMIEESHVNGWRRYYDEKHEYNGKTYILCDDWYHVDTALKNQKETKIPFIEWILSILRKKILTDSKL